jgi:bacterioferritin-associated ferredoxin
MIICSCCSLSDAAVDTARLQGGEQAARALVEGTGAGKDCGACQPTLEELAAPASDGQGSTP